ncbi:multiple sugar transport system permease protein [Paenibacillus sp. UNCCL117]|uniref:carbohydrate ABC transporter permease n=1 Tax=unclassified Paenibacillus TaxID=185978 RepID=UPI00089038B2|nr:MULTISPECIES: sugar ABC transporter permease [unclassified Paenibacillus]SDD07229.1 carbohydrate ABC transporter membrane protein 1, CUT1 family [Paenibacillus sp. cl123]SFW31527.1 multiple sugar transport system permease protein [Paenibacillus sp. UNCCL117]
MKLRNLLWSYLFIGPNLLFLLMFLIIPLFYTIYLSFFQADIYNSAFIGLDNYRGLFKETLFLKSFMNTFYFVLIIVPCVVVFSLIVAAMMQGFHTHAKSFFRLMFYLPVVSTPVVLSLVWSWMYNPSYGIVKYFAELIGFGAVDVFSGQLSAILALSGIVITWMVGQPIILYLSAMDGVSKELYEAAELDGAGPVRAFFSITLPMIAHTTLLIVVTSTISVFQIFVVIHLLTSGGPYHGTESLVYTIYRTAFISLEFGKASAQSVILFMIILVISLLQFRFMKSKLD